jgi:hypothetical protein
MGHYLSEIYPEGFDKARKFRAKSDKAFDEKQEKERIKLRKIIPQFISTYNGEAVSPKTILNRFSLFYSKNNIEHVLVEMRERYPFNKDFYFETKEELTNEEVKEAIELHKKIFKAVRLKIKQEYENKMADLCKSVPCYIEEKVFSGMQEFKNDKMY